MKMRSFYKAMMVIMTLLYVMYKLVDADDQADSVMLVMCFDCGMYIIDLIEKGRQ